MKLPYFTDSFLALVRKHAANVDSASYSATEPWAKGLPGFSAGVKESRIVIDEFPELHCDPEKITEADAQNAISLYEKLKMLTPVQASDERLWACLAHLRYWDYMRIRWPRGDGDSFKTRWFFEGNSMARLARNGLARLWWGAYATVRPENSDPYKLTRLLFQNTEVQFGYMERLFGKNTCVLHTALEYAETNGSRIRPRRSTSDWARETGKLINQAGGALQLDSMEPADVEAILEEYLQSIYKNEARS